MTIKEKSITMRAADIYNNFSTAMHKVEAGYTIYITRFRKEIVKIMKLTPEEEIELNTEQEQNDET